MVCIFIFAIVAVAFYVQVLISIFCPCIRWSTCRMKWTGLGFGPMSSWPSLRRLRERSSSSGLMSQTKVGREWSYSRVFLCVLIIFFIFSTRFVKYVRKSVPILDLNLLYWFICKRTLFTVRAKFVQACARLKDLTIEDFFAFRNHRVVPVFTQKIADTISMLLKKPKVWKQQQLLFADRWSQYSLVNIGTSIFYIHFILIPRTLFQCD